MTMVRPVVVLAAVALMTGACSGEIMTSRLHLANSDSFFQYGASPGEMLTIVVGNPFSVSRDVLDRAVTGAMQNNHNGPMTHFTTTPGAKAHLDYRIVIAFGTPPSMEASTLCGNPDAIPTGRRPADRLQAEVGFCGASDLYSSVNISMPAVASPNDPAFRHMIASAMWQLIPSRDPLSNDEGSCLGSGC